MSVSKDNDGACPCGSGATLIKCCLPYIMHERVADTACVLMRSRYSAYALGYEQYLLDSWHHSTRPEFMRLDPAMKWIRLKIVDAESLADQVEFVATFKLSGKAHTLREKSRFIQEEDRWYYLEAV